MKKIKSIKQLKAEKMRISQQLYNLENKMNNQWNELKYNLKPSSLLKDTFSSIIKNKGETSFSSENLVKSTLAFGISLLSNRLARKMGEKFSSLFKKKDKQQEPDDK